MASLQVRATQRALDGLVPTALLDGISEAERERAWRREIAVLPTDLRPTVAEVDGRVVGFMG
ncbi:MAG TPA: GNAT family N-acetyltransferase, partial [Candidatus Saccharimonadia bacterium]|nr:GNAT family N-acetyltransferase [Candidatus Saccharimonadia bacterium]